MIEIARARLSVAEPGQLGRVQRETRAFCRRAGFSESGVFQAVIAVSELAFRLLGESEPRVDLELSAYRHRDGLELRAESGAARVSLPFPRAAAEARAPAHAPRARPAPRG